MRERDINSIIFSEKVHIRRKYTHRGGKRIELALGKVEWDSKRYLNFLDWVGFLSLLVRFW